MSFVPPTPKSVEQICYDHKLAQWRKDNGHDDTVEMPQDMQNDIWDEAAKIRVEPDASHTEYFREEQKQQHEYETVCRSHYAPGVPQDVALVGQPPVNTGDLFSFFTKTLPANEQNDMMEAAMKFMMRDESLDGPLEDKVTAASALHERNLKLYWSGEEVTGDLVSQVNEMFDACGPQAVADCGEEKKDTA